MLYESRTIEHVIWHTVKILKRFSIKTLLHIVHNAKRALNQSVDYETYNLLHRVLHQCQYASRILLLIY